VGTFAVGAADFPFEQWTMLVAGIEDAWGSMCHHPGVVADDPEVWMEK